MVLTITGSAYGDRVMTKKKPIKPDISKSQSLTVSQVRTVEGIIQNVTDNSIQVRGKYYNIPAIPLKDPSGKNLNKTSLTTGKKVEIFFQEDRILSILIYDDMVE
jgi:hypothetical protein